MFRRRIIPGKKEETVDFFRLRSRNLSRKTNKFSLHISLDICYNVDK